MSSTIYTRQSYLLSTSTKGDFTIEDVNKSRERTVQQYIQSTHIPSITLGGQLTANLSFGGALTTYLKPVITIILA